MKAPEKIWMNDDWFNQFNDKDFMGEDSIEYIRTDVFIKKIETYLNSQLYDWVSITNPDQRSYPNVIPKKDFIEDFKIHMKGE